jgi:hypothetical protein
VTLVEKALENEFILLIIKEKKRRDQETENE